MEATASPEGKPCSGGFLGVPQSAEARPEQPDE